MSTEEDGKTSGYCSNLTINFSGEQEDEPDNAYVSIPNIEKILFDNADKERPPFSCCNSQVERSLVVLLIHYSLLVTVVTFCITFLTICDADSRFASGVPALLSACVGHILPGPRS